METKEEILGVLNKDYNKYSAKELQMFVENGVLEWSDLSPIFSEKEIDAICENEYYVCHPFPEMNNKPDPVIEIYFWGCQGSGKTCAIEALLTVLEQYGPLAVVKSLAKLIYKKDLRNEYDYHQPFHQTRNSCMILHGDDVKSDDIHVTKIVFEDKTKRKVCVSFIEVTIPFDSCYADVERMMYSIYKLHRPWSWVIHFFVAAYGSRDRWEQWRGLTSIVQTIDEQRFLCKRKKTLGAYVLVTKIDLMDARNRLDVRWFMPPSPNKEHPIEANRYVDDMFWKTLNDVFGKYVICDVKKISFTIGNVFAQTRCFFDAHDALKVINLILSKIKPENIFVRLWKRLFKKEPTYI